MHELSEPRAFAVTIAFGPNPEKRLRAATEVMQVAAEKGEIKRFLSTPDLSVLGVFLQSRFDSKTIFDALYGNALRQQTPALNEGDVVTIIHASYDHCGNSDARSLTFLRNTTRPQFLPNRK